MIKKADKFKQKHIGIHLDLYMEIWRKDEATLYPRKNPTRIGTFSVGMVLHCCSLDGVKGELRDSYTTKWKVIHDYIKKVEDELNCSKNPYPGIYTPT